MANPTHILYGQYTNPTVTATRPAAPAANPATAFGRYTLNMDPEVVAALSEEREGLADLQSAPMPSMPSTASYDVALRHLMENKPIQLGRLDYTLGVGKENIAHQNEIAKRNIMNSLAARGLSFSSDRGYLTHEQKRAYNIAMTDLTTRDSWARQDLDRNIQQQQESIAAARESANAAYANAIAQRAQGIKISERQLHNHVVQAYVNAYMRVWQNPALFLGADATFNPADFLGQIPK